jgi:hypothetical protein
MGATMTQLVDCLEQNELGYKVDEENQTVLTGFQTENVDNFQIVIGLDEEGKYLRFLAPGVLTDINDLQAPVIHQALLSISSQTTMVRWVYDPMTKEVSAMVDLPLMDSLLTAQQFYSCLEALVSIVDTIAMPRLNHILRTGIDPYALELGERLLLDLETSYPGSIVYIEQALTRRKSLAVAPEEEKSSSATTVWQKIWDVVVSGKK